MGCPDWPTCWGCWIPPTAAEQVDFSKLDIARYQRKAERLGRDPATITAETLKKEFNPRHVWTEYINRLCSLPVGFFTLTTFILSFWHQSKKPMVFWASFAALILVLINGWMGARVVYSGLAPGVLTLHMALAFLLIGIQTYIVWGSASQRWTIELSQATQGRGVKILLGLLVFCVLVEGVLGSQVRELTDQMSKHQIIARSEWGQQLESSWMYLIHRSFSWVILILTLMATVKARKFQVGGLHRPALGVIGIVFAQMLLGVVMSQVHVFGAVQVLHVGLAAILFVLILLWMLGLHRAESRA
jgi:heme a synthase